MRTAKDKFEDLKKRGRAPEQIRAIAVAIDDKELREMANQAMKEETAKVKDVVKVKATKVTS